MALDSVETPTETRDNVLGGSAVFFSYAASYFSPVRLVGVVGEDWPSEHTRLLAAQGIDTSGLHVVPGAKTFRWRGKYMPNMNDRETLEIHLNVFEKFDPVLPAEYRDCKFLFLANGSPITQMKVLDQVPDATLMVADTMDLWINLQHDELWQLLQRIDGLVLNDSEAKLLTDDENLVRAGHKVREMGPKFVVIKKGEHGAMFFSRARDVRHAGLSHARRRRSDRRRRQLCRRHDGLPGRARQRPIPRRSRRPWPTARSWPASTSRISASTA